MSRSRLIRVYFQDTMVHKVKGKEVERLRDEERKEAQFDRARRDTLDKISDYGKRKEVLENADTTYLTKTKHDVCFFAFFDFCAYSIFYL